MDLRCTDHEQHLTAAEEDLDHLPDLFVDGLPDLYDAWNEPVGIFSEAGKNRTTKKKRNPHFVLLMHLKFA